MILVFICIILLVFVLIILMSSIRIKFENIVIKDLKLNKDNNIFFQVYLFNKIKYLSIKINSKKISNSKRIKELKNKKSKFNLKVLKTISKVKLKIESLNLDAIIGYEDASILPNIIALLNILLSIIIPKFANNRENIKYSVKPIYNKNTLQIHFDCIFSIKIVHIIYVILELLKKGSMENERTSNRKPYAYSYE